jgi:phage tail-like protein
MTGNFGADFNASANVDLSAALDASLDVAASLDASIAASLNADASLGAGATFDASASLSLGKSSKGGAHDPDPWLRYRFKVEIESIGVMRFQKVEAISLDSQEERGDNGAAAGAAIMLPPRKWTWSPVTLKRGMASDGVAVWKWVMDTVTKPPIKPHNVTITLFDAEGKLGMQWTFVRAYPTAWSIEPLDASANLVTIDSLKLAHHGVTVQFGNSKYNNTGAPPPPRPNTANAPSAGGGNGSGGGPNSSSNGQAGGGNNRNGGGGNPAPGNTPTPGSRDPSRTGQSVTGSGNGTSRPPVSGAGQPHHG